MTITDEAFNNLKWEKLPAHDFDKETEGYNILGEAQDVESPLEISVAYA